VEKGYICLGNAGELSVCESLPVCGTGVREWNKGEACDDGNEFSGDGCSSTCTLEPDYTCTNYSRYAPDSCCALPMLCGNGVVGECCVGLLWILLHLLWILFS